MTNKIVTTAAASAITAAVAAVSLSPVPAEALDLRSGSTQNQPPGTTPTGPGGSLPGSGCNGNPACGGGTPSTGGNTVIKNNNSNAVNVQQKNTNRVSAAYLVPTGSCGTGFTLAVGGYAAGGFTWQDKGCKAAEALISIGAIGAEIRDNTMIAVSLAGLGKIYNEIGASSQFVAETIVKCGPSTKTASPVLTANGLCQTYTRSASKPRKQQVIVQADPAGTVGYKPVCVLVPVTKTPEPVCRFK